MNLFATSSAVRTRDGGRRVARCRRLRPSVEAMEVRALLSVGPIHADAGPIIPVPAGAVHVTATPSRNTVDLLDPVTFTMSVDTSGFQSIDVVNEIEEKNFFGNWVVIASGPQTSFTVTQRLGGVAQFRVTARLIVDTDVARDAAGEDEDPDHPDADDPVVNVVSPVVNVRVNFPSCAQIMADSKVELVANTAWFATRALAFLNQGPQARNGSFPQSRRAEIGYWIQIDTATGIYEHTGLVFGAFNAPDQGAGVIIGARPADRPAVNGLSAVYTVASFHTHTPTRYRSPFRVGRNLVDRRPVGPSGADEQADQADNVAGLVYDYTAAARTPGAVPFGWALNGPAKIYCTNKPGGGGMNRRV